MKNIKYLIFVIVLNFSIPALAQFSIYGHYDGPESGDPASLQTYEIDEHPNLSRCLCDQAATIDDGFSYYFSLAYAGLSDSSDVYFYIGSDCSNTAVPLTQCGELGTENINSFDNSNVFVPIPVNRVVDPAEGICEEKESGSNTFYIFSSTETRDELLNYTINYDTAPPSEPYNVTVTSGENALNVSWDSADIDEEGIEYYNILCMTADGSPAGNEDNGIWVSTEEICGKVLTVDASDSTDVDSCPSDALAEGERAYKCYVCGTISAPADNYRIENLDNGTVYSVAVVAIDDYKNVSYVSEVVDASPAPTTDFAEHYTASGGSADGDYCFIATAVYGDKNHPFVKILRVFRNKFLLTNSAGRSFVKWYYKNGRSWAAFIHANPWTKVLLFIGLFFLVMFAAILLLVPWWGFFLFAGFIRVLQIKYRKRSYVS
jgi:hypothetical protein